MADIEKRRSFRADAFTSIAVWQFMAFILLLSFVWASEFLDLPAIVFGTPRTQFNPHRVLVLSVAIGTAGVIAVGHTYERQRAVIKKILMTCLYCHRVKTEDGTWEHVEEYFIKHYPVAMNRGACPSCREMLDSVDQKVKEHAE